MCKRCKNCGADVWHQYCPKCGVKKGEYGPPKEEPVSEPYKMTKEDYEKQAEREIQQEWEERFYGDYS